MIALSRLDHVVFRVSDIAAAIAFWRDVLGAALEREQAAIGLWQMRAGEALIDLVSVDGELGSRGGAAPGRQGRNVDHVCLRVDPWDEAAIRSHLERHAVPVLEAGIRYGSEGDGPSLYIPDPDGNVIELKGPALPGTRA
jgi:glyoxylase I family protein